MPSSSSKLIKELVLQPLVDFLMEQLLPLSSRWESRLKTLILITSPWKLTVYHSFSKFISPQCISPSHYLAFAPIVFHFHGVSPPLCFRLLAGNFHRILHIFWEILLAQLGPYLKHNGWFSLHRYCF